MGDENATGATHVLKAETAFVNLSPYGFHRNARHWYKAKRDFVSPDKFSIIPYALLCRAIELELKSRHLEASRQHQVKQAYGHDLEKAYNALPAAEQILDAAEYAVLVTASEIYDTKGGKGFDYFRVHDACIGYSNFPDLNVLDAVAKKLIDSSPQKGLT